MSVVLESPPVNVTLQEFGLWSGIASLRNDHRKLCLVVCKILDGQPLECTCADASCERCELLRIVCQGLEG